MRYVWQSADWPKMTRHLGLSYAGTIQDTLPVDGLVEVILDAAQNYNKTLSASRLKGWHAALFSSGYSGLHKIKSEKVIGNVLAKADFWLEHAHIADIERRKEDE